MRLKIFTDGGARGNPGPAAVGVVIKNQNNEVIDSFGKTIGVSTNNVAEYSAVISAFLWVMKTQKFEGIDFFLDSQLIVSQLNGAFKVKNSKLRELIFQIRQLEQEAGGNVSYKAIPREQNRLADSLVNNILDKER